MNQNRLYSSVLLMVLCSFLPLSAIAHPEPLPYTGSVKNVSIGVLAKRGKKQCLKRWQPMADYLTAKLPGYHFKIIPLGFNQIQSAVQKGKLDFILSNPMVYVELEHDYNVNRIVTLQTFKNNTISSRFGGVIFCRADDKRIKQLSDLKNKRFMAVQSTSLGGWVMAWRLFKTHGIDPFSEFKALEFGGTHDNVVYAVRDGKVDAGTVRTDVLEHMADEGKINLSEYYILHKQNMLQQSFPFLCSTRLYPEWPLAKLKHTPETLAKSVAVALMEMHPDSQAAKLSFCAGWSTPMNYQSVHACLQALQIGPYRDHSRGSFQHLLKKHWLLLLAIFVGMLLLFSFAFYVYRVNIKLNVAVNGHKEELAHRINAERDMRQVFNTAGDGMRVVNKNLETIEVNNSFLEMTGWQRDDVLNMKCYHKSICHQNCQPDQCYLKNLLNNEERIEEEVELITATSETKPCILTATPFFDKTGNIAGMIQNFKDVTNRDLIIESRKNAAIQEGKIEMAATILHDIGNAITGLGTNAVKTLGDFHWQEVNSLEKLKRFFVKKSAELEQVFGPQKATDMVTFLDTIKISLEKRADNLKHSFEKIAGASGHINEILNLHRLYIRNNNPNQYIDLNLTDLVNDALAIMSASLEKRKIAIQFKHDMVIPTFSGDKTKLMQVIINILKNSCEEFDRCDSDKAFKMHITLSEDTASKQLVLNFTDNATGFRKNEGEQFFEKGYSSKNRDSGFGLFQCRTIIVSHGGSIHMTSQGVGCGASTIISIPYSKQ